MALGPWITEDDKRAVMAVLDSSDLMSGKQVAMFEEELAAYFGKRHAVCVSSGTAALECAFVATGDGRVVHPHGFVAILSAARAVHKTAEFDDVMPHDAQEGVRTDVLGVEVAPHLGVRVHDCAHRFDKGAAHAEVSCFSFAPNKYIAAIGGCLVTDDSVVAATARQYRNHGRDGGPEIFREGRNLRMPEINAALGRSQLKRIGEILEWRKQVAWWYDFSFKRLHGNSFPEVHTTRESHFLYPYHCPGHKHRSLADFRLFNTATQEDRDTALLPIWPTMTREEVEAIVRELPCKS